MKQLELISDNTVKHHFLSFINNDLEEILSDYTEQSVIITGEQDYTGLAEIRSFFTQAIALFPTNKSNIIIDKFSSSKNIFYVVWHGENPEFRIVFSTATYNIIEGKILHHTIGRVTAPK